MRLHYFPRRPGHPARERASLLQNIERSGTMRPPALMFLSLSSTAGLPDRQRTARRAHAQRTYRFLLSVLVGSVISGCGAAAIPPTCQVPKAVELEIETSDRVNADAEGRSLPTIVRVYQLTDLSVLQMSAFEDIWEHAKETLGAALAAVEEFTTYPGQVVVRHFDRNDKADYLVGVAIFRNPVGSTWRTIQEFPLPGDPCKDKHDKKAAPKLADLRVRMFLEDYRIESVTNYVALRKRSCGDKASCASAAAPDELPTELRHRRLRDFEEDPSRPKPTAAGEGP
jgi:type VI secretion system protein VasD